MKDGTDPLLLFASGGLHTKIALSVITSGPTLKELVRDDDNEIRN